MWLNRIAAAAAACVVFAGQGHAAVLSFYSSSAQSFVNISDGALGSGSLSPQLCVGYCSQLAAQVGDAELQLGNSYTLYQHTSTGDVPFQFFVPQETFAAGASSEDGVYQSAAGDASLITLNLPNYAPGSRAYIYRSGNHTFVDIAAGALGNGAIDPQLCVGYCSQLAAQVDNAELQLGYSYTLYQHTSTGDVPFQFFVPQETFAAGASLEDGFYQSSDGQASLISFTLPNEFAAAAAPEPASWLMMILGFGLVGGAMRKRKRIPIRLDYLQMRRGFAR
jgi:hypothetical protein